MINLKLPIYREKTLRLAMEFGLVLSEVAKEQNKELSGDITQRAQDIFLNEIKINGFKKTALNFIPLILAALEFEETKKKDIIK